MNQALEQFKPDRWPWGRAVALVLIAFGLSGCLAPVSPQLVPLPAARMPSPEQLAFSPWRLAMVASDHWEQAGLEDEFKAALMGELRRYGILTLTADASSRELQARMLELQVHGGQEATVRDPLYELQRADGIVNVSVTSVNILRDNAPLKMVGRDGKAYVAYTSEVQVNGAVSLTRPRSGTTETVPFSVSDRQSSFNRRHYLQPQTLASSAVRRVAVSSQVLSLFLKQFPLEGYIVGTADNPKHLKLNRGYRQGVQLGRRWALYLTLVEPNPMLGTLESEKLVGRARTIEVQADYCVIKCDSRATRNKVKLGMKARAEGFGFSLDDLLMQLGTGM